MKTYELFSGQELVIAEKIQQRRLQVLVHSCVYYELNGNVISDKQWDTWARELESLQKEYPDIAKQIVWADAFKEFDASSGFNLPIRDEWVMRKAKIVSGIVVKPKKAVKAKNKKRRLF